MSSYTKQGMEDGERIGGQTFAVETAFFFLRICGFAARVIKCEEVERKVAKIVLYSSFGVSDCATVLGEPVMRRKRRFARFR